MKLSELKSIIREEIVKVSKGYQKKEDVRKDLEDLIKANLSKGIIASQKELDEFNSSIQLAMTSLKMVPFEVWKKLQGAKK